MIYLSKITNISIRYWNIPCEKRIYAQKIAKDRFHYLFKPNWV